MDLTTAGYDGSNYEDTFNLLMQIRCGKSVLQIQNQIGELNYSLEINVLFYKYLKSQVKEIKQFNTILLANTIQSNKMNLNTM